MRFKKIFFILKKKCIQKSWTFFRIWNTFLLFYLMSKFWILYLFGKVCVWIRILQMWDRVAKKYIFNRHSYSDWKLLALFTLCKETAVSILFQKGMNLEISTLNKGIRRCFAFYVKHILYQWNQLVLINQSKATIWKGRLVLHETNSPLYVYVLGLPRCKI